MPPSTRSAVKIPELDSLRGLAIVLVLLTHYDGYVNWGHNHVSGTPIPFLRAVVLGGHTAVTLFFLLSAFLLSRPFLAEAAGGPRVVLPGYFARRFWRIVPLYALVVVTTAVLCATQWSDVRRAIPYLLFLTPFVPPEERISPLLSGAWWSLSTEIQFYLLLPLLPLLLRSRRLRALGVAVLVTYAAAYLALVSGFMNLGSTVLRYRLLHSVLGRGPLFLLGVLLAFIYERHGVRIQARAARTRWLCAGGADAALIGLLLSIGISLGVTMSAFTYAELEARYPWWHIPEGIVWAVVMLLCLLAPLRLKAIVVNRVMSRLGALSYSLYLLHGAIFFNAYRYAYHGKGAGWDPAAVLVAVAIGIACVACSAVTYRLVEQPMIAFGARRPAVPVAADRARTRSDRRRNRARRPTRRAA